MDNNDYPELIEYLDQKFQKTATKEDLEAFATKEDLEAFATKEDLEAFATKEDLEAFATKEDLEAFATKEELDEAVSGLATKEELYLVRDELRRDVQDLNEKFNQVIDGLDRLTKSIEILSQEYAALGAKTDRHEKWIQQIAEKVGVKLEY